MLVETVVVPCPMSMLFARSVSCRYQLCDTRTSVHQHLGMLEHRPFACYLVLLQPFSVVQLADSPTINIHSPLAAERDLNNHGEDHLPQSVDHRLVAGSDMLFRLL